MEGEENTGENGEALTPPAIPENITDPIPELPEEKEDIKTWLMTVLKPLQDLTTSLVQSLQTMAETQTQIVADLSTLKAPIPPTINETNKVTSNIASEPESLSKSAVDAAGQAAEIPAAAARKTREMLKL